MMMRRRQIINALKIAVADHAAKIEGAVIRPSRSLVKSMIGMRMRDGNRPK